MNGKKQRAFLIATLSILCTGMLFGACNTFEDSNSSNGEHVHTWGEKQTVAPTCTEQGYDMRTCTMCGEEEKSNFLEAGHTWKEMRSFDEEFHWFACKNCEEIKDEAMHTLGDDDICTGCTYMRIPTEGVVYEVSEDGTYATVVRYIGSLSHVNIAKMYQGVPVTSVGEGAFYNSYLTSIIIPDSVTSIGTMAFAGCTRLKSIMIGEGVEFIGDMAFTLTASLTRFTVSEDNATYKSVDGNLYTKDGTTLIQYASGKATTEFTVPNGVKKINPRAFSASLNLKSVIISNDVENIGEAAFSTCLNLESVVIGSGVASIGEYAFIIEYGGLKSIVVDDNNANYKSIDGNLYTKDGTTLLQYAAGKEAASFAILDGVTMIGDYAFNQCSNLSNIILPESVATIGNYAFNQCGNLTDITLSNNVTTIGYDPFYNCDKIENVKMPTLAIPYIPQTNLKTVVITAGETIGDSAFSRCGTLTDVRILEGITSIGDYAFSRCKNLKNLTIPDGITTIGDFAFYNCSSLTDIIIPESVTTIGDSAFYNCDKIENVEMPTLAIPYIPQTNLKTVVITAGETIENEAFANGGHLTSLTLPDSITAIGINAFYNCENLTCITFNGIVEQWNAIEKSFWCKENVSTPKIVCMDGELTKEGHLWGEVKTVAPTCTEQGYDVIKCALCEVEKERSNYTPIQHTWGEEVQTVAPTCTEQGYDIIKCTLCEVEEKCNFVDAKHTWGAVQTVAPTCTEQGYDVIKCVLCEEEKERSKYTPIQHTWGEKQTVAPTCTEQGYDVIKCILCEVEQQRDNFVEARHTWKDAPSFDEKSHWFECVYCEEIKDKAVHKIKTDDTCLECEYVRIPTEGVVYQASQDGTYAMVVGYTGTSTHVNIARYQYLEGDLDTKIPVTIIGDNAFKSCSILKSINIPDSVTTIGANAFYNCDALQEIIIPDSVTTIGVSAFQSCNGLTNIEIGDGVIQICDKAFYLCTSVTEIVIPDSVTTIGVWAFYQCRGLIDIVIPDSVTTIGGGAFLSCNNLTSVYITDIEAWCKITFGDHISNPLYYAKNLYLNNQLVTELVIPENVTAIGDYAFYNYDALQKLNIPDSVNSIGKEVLYSCSGLTEMTLPFIGETKDGGGNTHFGYIFGARSYSDNDYYVPKSLKKVIITSATSIDYGAFENCSSLTSVTIGDGVTSIGGAAFRNCSGLENITIPDGVTSIGVNAFDNCDALQEIIIPDSVTTIGASAFESCNALTNIEIGNGITSIGQKAFYNCSSLTSINVDVDNGNYKSIDGNLYAKDGTTLLQYAIGKTATSFTIPDGVATIGKTALCNCSSLTSIEIPDSVICIDSSAFSNCSSLTSIVIPDSVVRIESSAFCNCSSLTSIVIPDSVTTIGSDAFYHCDSLMSVYITDIKAWCNISFGNYFANPLYYAKNLYLNNELATELEIPNTVTEIKAYVFYNCENLTSIVIPDSVTSIGDEVFYGCTGLTSVGIGEGVTSIGSRAFLGCSGLTNITIPERVTTIGLEAFFGCGGLTEIRYNAIECADIESCEPSFGAFSGAAGVRVIVGAKVKRLPGYLFWSCDGLTSVTIPDSVTSIGNFAFSYCSGLTSIEIPDGVTSIGSYAFAYCDSLTNVTIGNGVTSIGSSAFYNCSGLTSITIPDSVKNIAGSAFYYCKNLTTVTIGDGVTNIDRSAFWGCSRLKDIRVSKDNIVYKSIDGSLYTKDGKTLLQYAVGKETTSFAIPDGVTSIGSYAFYDCSSLTSVTIGDSVTIDTFAFYDCSSLTNVTLSDGVTALGGSVFWNCGNLISVTFRGTIAQWDRIEKSSTWENGSAIKIVVCSDGTVSI